MKRIQSILSREPGGRLFAKSAPRRTRLAVLTLAILACSFFIISPAVFVASGNMQKGAPLPSQGQKGQVTGVTSGAQSSQAVGFGESIALRDIKLPELTPEQRAKLQKEFEDREKNELNRQPIKSAAGAKGGPFTDKALDTGSDSRTGPNAVTNPIANFDGIDMDSEVSGLGFGRFAPPDTNSDTGPNHIVMAINSAIRVYDKTGSPLTTLASLGSLFANIGGPCANSNDGDPIVLYDPLADRWLISEFCVDFSVSNSMHELVAISKTGDPTGAYFVYDFLMPAGRFTDYPHFGVWPDGYYMTTNDFNTAGTAFLGDSFFAFNRAKMLIGDPTANYVVFTNNFPGNPLASGGFLPTDIDGVSLPPAGTPNLIIQFLALDFGDPINGLRIAEFRPNYTTPASSTLTQLPDVPVAAFDARQPASRAVIDQPPPAAASDSLDAIADRLMHRLAYRRLQDGSQSYVMNWTVNVSGVNPTNAATYQGGVRWEELRRDNMSGAMSVRQEATYAPGAGNGATGRNLWMASVAQDGEGNMGLAASATGISPALNPTGIYTGRLFGDPLNTTPQGEVDAMSAVTKGVQTGTGNRWGDYSSLMVDPADECTFWGSIEYVDSPTASFDWNTRIFSFKVNPNCVTAPRGAINGTITNCATGQPLANAIITTPDGFFRQTNGSGNFSMTVAPGTYTVNVSGPPGGGFSQCTQMVTVTAGGTSTVNCCLGGIPIIVSAGATLVAESCSPANGALDPNEQVTISFCVQNTGALSTTNLVGALANTGGVTGASGPQNYGVVVAGGPAVCRDFTFFVNGTCGGTVTASIQFQDGANNLGTVTYNFTLGVVATALAENFDGVTAPALPPGWVSTTTAGAANCTPTGTCALTSQWVTQASGADTAPNAAFHNDPSCVTDNTLDTPAFAVTAANAQVTFRNNFNTENTFDGCVLEVSSPNIAGGAFTDITNAAVGGSFVSGGYNGTISVNFLSPIAGRQAWTGNSAGYITTIANLGPNVNGQTIKLRFRFASDCSVSATGWTIDTIKVTAGFVCSTSCPAPMCTGITCPANIVQANDPNQCGAVVTYPAPSPVGSGCGTITCAPASGAFFPKGTTTVTCSATAGPTCSFTVTVNDTQPPTITCPANQTVVANQNACPSPACQTVTYPTPTVSDNCPGAGVVCTPPSGSCFPTGVTTVTCTATDTSGNTATCSFTVTTFDVILQDDSNPSIVLLWNSLTGAYRFCCNGTVYTGVGKSSVQGCVYTLTHNPADRRVLGRVDKATHSGTASIQAPAGTNRCTITDRSTLNDINTCQ